LALAYLQDNNSSQGIAELKKAVAHNPNFLEGILLLANLNLRNNNPQEVIPAMVELLKKQTQLDYGPSVISGSLPFRGSPG
jgi:Predicted N-acetylglucosaminyl transferase